MYHVKLHTVKQLPGWLTDTNEKCIEWLSLLRYVLCTATFENAYNVPCQISHVKVVTGECLTGTNEKDLVYRQGCTYLAMCQTAMLKFKY